MKKLLLTISLIVAPALLAPVAARASETSISVADSDGIEVKVRSGGLEISVSSETALTFQIYSVTGQLIKTVRIADGNESIDLPPGYYIVKCEKWSHRYLVN